MTKQLLNKWRYIQGHRKAQVERRKNEAKQRAMVANISDVIAIIDENGINTYKSPNIEKWFGWPANELIGSSIWLRIHPEDLTRTKQFFCDLLEEPFRSGTTECRYQCKDSSYRDVAITAVNLLHDPDILGVLLNYHDITQSKLAENELRRYASRLIEVEETLRKHLAAELHDEIGRDLTAIGMNLSVIGGILSSNGPNKVHELLRDSSKLIEDISKSVRGIMSYLRPPVLDDFGLVAALRWHAELYSKRTGIKVIIRADQSFPRLSLSVETAIFRISQEALVNIAKYANTDEVTILLKLSDEVISFFVVDEGSGFTPTGLTTNDDGSGWGIKIMRERAELIGGSFQLDSSPEVGTVVSIHIPFKEALHGNKNIDR